MLQVSVNDNELREAGYVDINNFKHVYISSCMLAKIFKVSPTTVRKYAKAGLIKKNEDDKINLAYALTLDFNELRTKYLSER